MNRFELIILDVKDYAEFTSEIQKAFQLGYEAEFGPCDTVILPEKDVAESLNKVGNVAYCVKIDGNMAGGAIVGINPEAQHNTLELLFVKVGTQSRGIGLSIWNAIEKLHPDTKVWETSTPYFEKRNIHFYVNRCGFHIVEFFNPCHKEPNQDDEPAGGMPTEVGNYFFRFEKTMK